MEMVKFVLATAFAACTLRAADFSLTIGNPIAANLPKVSKSVGMAVRLENCADLSNSTLTGTAEGVADGERKSVRLQILGGVSGVYAVNQTWPQTGAWVVNLTATCGSAKAGAVVPFRGATYLRDAIKSFPRFATAAEVDLSLKQVAGGAK
jgi:hypothetical protein